MQTVIDISEHNGTVDFSEIKKAGFHVIIRAGFGGTGDRLDYRFRSNVAECELYEIPYGIYWYSYAADDIDALDEAKACLGAVSSLTSKEYLRYPIFYDIEEYKSQKNATQIAVAFCDKVEKENYFAGIYASEYYFRTFIHTDKYTKWVAKWSDYAPSIDFGMWQYTSRGYVKGCEGYVDISKVAINYPEIILKLGLTGQTVVNSNSDSINEAEKILALACIDGFYGNGADRKNNLYKRVQGKVNAILAKEN